MKKWASSVVLFVLVFALFFSRVWAKKPLILMIIAHKNFRDEELLIPKKIFERAGYKVVVASSTLKVCKGMLGSKVKPDLLISKVNVKKYAAVVFVGGTGAVEYFNSPQARRIIREAYEQGKVIGAICLAPCILAKAGILKGKKATIWYSESFCLLENGARYTGKPVTVDGKIVTGAGPFAAKDFALAILKLLEEERP